MLQHFARQHDYSSLTPARRAPSAFSTTGGGRGGAGGGSLMSPGLCHVQILHPKPLQGEPQNSTLLGLSQQSVKWGFADTASAPRHIPGQSCGDTSPKGSNGDALPGHPPSQLPTEDVRCTEDQSSAWLPPPRSPSWANWGRGRASQKH